MAGCQPAAAPAANKAKKPVEVDCRQPELASLVEHEEFAGRLVAAEAIEIKARVSGHLEKVLFKDGDDVQIGQPLFEIDDRPYKAEFDRASANVAQFQSKKDKLASQEARAKRFLMMKSISQEDYDTVAFDLAEASANVLAAKASRDLAELNLGYTTIHSRINGRISRHLVDVGNLVRADETALTRVVSLDPIHAYFDVDERTVLRLQRLVRDGKIASARDTEIPIEVTLADKVGASLTARFNFLDNEVDPTTGTLLGRAEISNPDRMLSPGLFVRLRVPIGEPREVLLIPEEALASDQGERYVFVVNAENKVEYRRVEVGWREKGKRVISSGLTADDRVIVTNLQRVRAKDEVHPKLLKDGE
ncbi:MAG: efflux RND transporter periplasmic adaptor subunit [Planctomycetota bacterium]|nr:efflux RND transporter periplasmic adaptor subunit [Planctomycetota bacterium]